MARYFKVPFAKDGDRATVPDNIQSDGSVSFAQGYGYDYERDQETDPQAKDIGREHFNGFFHDITEAVGEIQKNGVATWSNQVTYSKGAFVWLDEILYLSISNENKTQPPSASWTTIYDRNSTSVDANGFLRAEGDKTTLVTSDLVSDTSSAAADKPASAKYANDAYNLANSKWPPQATTGTGNIARMSEVNRKLDESKAFGVRQKWVDVTSQRVKGTVYKNNTNKVIFISITINTRDWAAHQTIDCFVDSIMVASIGNTTAYSQFKTATFPVPPNGEYYAGNSQSIPFVKWAEFR